MDIIFKIFISLSITPILYWSSFKSFNKVKVIDFLIIPILGFSIGIVPVILKKTLPDIINENLSTSISVSFAVITGIYTVRLIFNSILTGEVSLISKLNFKNSLTLKNKTKNLFNFHSIFLFVGGILIVNATLFSSSSIEQDSIELEYSLEEILLQKDKNDQIAIINNHIISIKETYDNDSLSKEQVVFNTIDSHNSAIIFNGYDEYIKEPLYTEQNNYKIALQEIGANNILLTISFIDSLLITESINFDQIDSLYNIETDQLQESLISYVRLHKDKFK
jgi:hypothetical protein